MELKIVGRDELDEAIFDSTRLHVSDTVMNGAVVAVAVCSTRLREAIHLSNQRVLNRSRGYRRYGD